MAGSQTKGCPTTVQPKVVSAPKSGALVRCEAHSRARLRHSHQDRLLARIPKGFGSYWVSLFEGTVEGSLFVHVLKGNPKEAASLCALKKDTPEWVWIKVEELGKPQVLVLGSISQGAKVPFWAPFV